MSLESEVLARLKTVCPRSFVDFAPTDTVRPYVTYQTYGGQVLNYGDDAIPDKRNASVQISVWADTHISAQATIQAIEDALRTSTTIQARPMSAASIEGDAEIAFSGLNMAAYSAIQDFTVWATR